MNDLMDAVQILRFGGPEVLALGRTIAPVARPGHVVVRIRAASVNNVDCGVRAGRAMPDVTLPHVPGRDFCGVVASVGEGADLMVGEEVVGVCPNGVEGAYAGRIAIESALLARKPPELGHARAAAVGVAGLTAVAALVDALMLQPGERLLVNGGSGGVGSLAILAAQAIGASVAATARPPKHAYVLQLGADAVFDPDAVPAGRFDAVLDTVGGAAVDAVFAALKPGGRAAFLASGPVAPPAPGPQFLSLRPRVDRGRAALERTFRLLPADRLAALQVTEVPLAQAARAHALFEARGVCGKVVLVC